MAPSTELGCHLIILRFFLLWHPQRSWDNILLLWHPQRSWGDVLLFYVSVFLFFFFFFFCPAYILGFYEPIVMELYHNVNQHLQIFKMAVVTMETTKMRKKSNCFKLQKTSWN